MDDVPTSPYNILELGAFSSTEEDPSEAVTAFFVRAEAAPLLPIVEDRSRVQPKASLMPVAVSSPPPQRKEEEKEAEGVSSLALIWNRRWWILGAASAAFVLAAAAGRVTASSRAQAVAVPVVAAPAPVPQPVVSPSPVSALEAQPTSPNGGAELGAATAVEAQPSSTQLTPSHKTAHRARAVRPAPRVAVKRPFTPTEI